MLFMFVHIHFKTMQNLTSRRSWWHGIGDIDWTTSHTVFLSVSADSSGLSVFGLRFIRRAPLLNNFQKNFQSIDKLLAYFPRGQQCRVGLCRQKDTVQTHWNVLLTSSPVRRKINMVTYSSRVVLTKSHGRCPRYSH